MSLKLILLPLMLLSVAFPTGTSGQKIVCYILDNVVGKANFSFFWDHLPTNKCSRFIYLLESVNRYKNRLTNMNLYLMSVRSKHVPIELGVPVNNYNSWYIINYAVSWANTYLRGRIHLIWDDNLPLAKKDRLVKDIIWKGRHTRISQAVTCIPGVPRRVATQQMLTGFMDLYIVQAKVHQEDLNQFIRDPSVCVEPLLKLGVPKEKIVIGLSRVISMNTKYILVCKDQTAAQLLYDVGRSLQCLVRDRNLHGVMFWDVSSDDYTDFTCGKGNFPLLTHYQEAGSNCNLREP